MNIEYQVCLQPGGREKGKEKLQRWYNTSDPTQQGQGQIIKGLQGFTIVAYSPRLWLMASGETSSTRIKN